MKATEWEAKSVSVPKEAKQAEEAQNFSWVEPAVWTERMLAALKTEVKGGKWFSLMDKVYHSKNLEAAWEKVRANRGSAGVDRQTVQKMEAQIERHVKTLEEALKNSSYKPNLIKRMYIPKGKGLPPRPLGIPTVKDRIVQTALKNVLEPIFEVGFSSTSFGFRPKRGAKDALRQVDALLKQGYTFVVDADLENFFATISHDLLMREVEKKIADGRVLSLIKAYLNQGVMEGMKELRPEGGTPQGAVISPLLANVYLDSMDKEMARQVHQMVRYADDFVILCKGEEEAKVALAKVQKIAEEKRLSLHKHKTKIVDATAKGGFDFLGYHFERGMRWPRKKSLAKLKDRVRMKTRRNSGESLSKIVQDINPTLRGWFEYFKHSHETTFAPVDSWMRMRLRSILRKRRGGKGRGRGRDHQRWPNSFFAEQGLFTLTIAHASLCQSPRGNH